MTETVLVERAREGRAEAVAIFVERYQEPIYAFIYRYVGNAADAEDITQEVFVKALGSLDRFEGRSSLATWLFAIAANAARDFLRRRRQPEPLDLDDIERCLPAAPGGTSCAVERTLAAERRQAVREAIDALPPRERTAVLLRTYHDRTYEEIGEVLGCTANAVGIILTRARQRMSTLLEGWAE